MKNGNHYMVPAADPQVTQTGHINEDAYFSYNYNTTPGDPEMPFITTYPTGGDLNSIWIFVPVQGESNYYYIVHAKTGKYLKFYIYLTGNNARRKFIHLETIDSPGETEKFEITARNTGVKIKPKSNTMYFNIAGGNQNRYNGGTSSPYYSGIIGGMDGADGNSQFELINASSAADLTPVISDVDESTNSFTITSPAAAFSTIRYTIDGTTTPDANTGTATNSGSPIAITDSWTVQAVGVFGNFVTPMAGPKDLNPSQCSTPVISYDYNTETASITCATSNVTLYYTTDGSTPTTSSAVYTGPFPIAGPTTVKAIAVRTNFPNSEVATLDISQVATPTIQNNGYNAIVITTATPGATIYYTTDGSTPTTSSTEYLGPLTENVSNVTIKAIAVKENMIISEVGSGSVMLQCATPVITRVGLTFTLSCSLPTNASLYYTLDGGPETEYTGPVSFTSEQLPMTVVAVARHDDYTQSEEASMILRNGEGTPDDPYLIYSNTDFYNFVNDVNSGATSSACYKLGNNVSANGIGAITSVFSGTFDGGSYTLTDLANPLFNIVDGGTVKNLTLKNVAISSTADTIGAIVCIAKGYSRIYNCGILPNTADFPAGTHPSVVTTGKCAGGLVGSLRDDSRVINCYSYADVGAADIASGIVGRNTFASNTAVTGGKYANLRTAVVNNMFYGDILGGINQYGVYGGELITNASATGISSYNYFRQGTKFTAANGHPNSDVDPTNVVGNPTAYNCSFPADERYLTQVEFHRSLLNSNRELCGWWVGSDVAPSTLTTAQVQAIPKDPSLMYKWVVDPNLAPYPMLKPFGKYPSIVNGNTGTPWFDRTTANPYEGKQLGTLTVTVKSGSQFSAPDKTLYIPITDMDTLNYDFGYCKVQLPYYNTVFGNPDGATWEEKYAGNYTDHVVTGWMVTAVSGGTQGTFLADWQYGYNFADRKCTDKDLYGVSGRIFAQGGNYYVPDGVTAITIEAYWGEPIYLMNRENSYDRVNIIFHNNGNTGSHFAPAGTRGNNVNGATIYTEIVRDVIDRIPQKKTVYDYAIVLVGNVQESNSDNTVTNDHDKRRGFTIMSVDLDFDEEPDYCLEWQLGKGVTRNTIAPIRFDFLPVVELGIAGKLHNSTNFFSLGCFRSFGQFEVTETSLIRFGQFEFELGDRDEGPVILNGGIYDQYCRGRNGETNQHINYVILGGHIVMPSFTPGAHVNNSARYQTRHCAVNALGGDFTSFYLTGGFNEGITPYEDNPHCYIDGGRFGTIAAAFKEGIWGDVTWRINHALIGEFYGGGTMSQATGTNYKIVKGSIDVVIDNSIVEKYCGGPKFGNMLPGKTVTTSATNTVFTRYYGAGNGGTNYVQYDNTDTPDPPYSDARWQGIVDDHYHPTHYLDGDKGYEADYDFEVINTSTGTTAGQVVNRSYYYSAQFATTNTGNVTSTLTNCIVKKNFYGGGFLGGVSGNVTSTLTDTRVFGSAFGAGYSASVDTVVIHGNDKNPPVANIYTGLITYTPNGTSNTYTWTNDPSLSPSHPISSDNKFFFTEVSVDHLGAVSDNVIFTIQGKSSIGTFENGVLKSGTGNVFGGGDESTVDGNTLVKVLDQTKVFGNIYGGGNMGEIGGDTKVIINGVTPQP